MTKYFRIIIRCLLNLSKTNFVNFELISNKKMVISGDIRRTTKDDASFAETIERIGRNIASATPAQQLGIGGVTGWTVGFIGMKVGKAAALTIGCGLVVVQIASYKGYINFNWKKFESQAAEVKNKLKRKFSTSNSGPTSEQVVQLFKDHIYLTGGFTAGFFLGLGSA